MLRRVASVCLFLSISRQTRNTVGLHHGSRNILESFVRIYHFSEVARQDKFLVNYCRVLCIHIHLYVYILQKEAEHGGNDRGLQSWRKRKRSDSARKRERENGSWTLCREKGEKGVGEAEAEPEEMTERDALWDTESSNKAGPITDYRPFPFPIDLHSNRCYTLSSRILMDYQFESSRELQSSTHSLSTQNRLLSNPPISTVSSIS